MNIAIIPARGGSKRIKLKNVKNFFGKPIIFYTIQTLKKTKLFNKIYVSTDNSKIAFIAKKYGAEVPHLRSKKLSNDFAITQEVIKDMILKLKNKGVHPNKICCMYPTAPLITKDDIKKGYKKLSKNIDFVFSAYASSTPVHRSFELKNGKLKLNFPKFFKKRTQDLPKIIFDAGQFYWGKSKFWEKKINHFKKTSVILLPKNRAVDIDNMEDWRMVEKNYKRLRNEKKIK